MSVTPNFTALIYPPCVPSNYTSYQLVPTYIGSSIIRSYLIQPGYPLQPGKHCQLKVIGNDGSSNTNIFASISVTFVARTLNIVQPTHNQVIGTSASFMVQISTNALGTALFAIDLVATGCITPTNYSLGRYIVLRYLCTSLCFMACLKR